MSRSNGLALLAFLALPTLASTSGAAQFPPRADYRIRLTLEGVGGSANFEGCPARPGKEVLEGTVSGDESTLADDQFVEYAGVLERKSTSAFCDLRGEGETEYCVTNLTGKSKVKLKIKIHADRDGAWIQWRPVAGSGTGHAAGDCEPGMTAEIQDAYMNASEISEMPMVPAGPLVEGKRHIDKFEGGSTTLEVLEKRGLRAKPGGPYSFERAATITLDGSGSTAEQGHSIQSYVWDLTPSGTPEGCTGIGTPARMTGATVTFVALCSMSAKLTVRDDQGEEDADTADVTVKPRPWQSKLTTADAIRRESFTFVPNGFVFGYNRCSRDGHFDENSNHWYEPRPGSVNDFEEGTFWLDEVSDDGPFAGTFYVTRGDFNMPRALWVNKRLSPGGDVYDLNPGPKRQVKSCQSGTTCTFGEPEIDRLRRSVELHEKLHSTLANRALGARKDPAKEVESGMAMNRGDLAGRANGLLVAAVSEISNASSESDVKAEMRKTPEFLPGGCIDFPAWDSAVKGCFYKFASFIDK